MLLPYPTLPPSLPLLPLPAAALGRPCSYSAAALAAAVLDATSRAAAVIARAIMSTSDEISTAFTAAADIFNLSLGAPTDADVECIQRAVVEIL